MKLMKENEDLRAKLRSKEEEDEQQREKKSTLGNCERCDLMEAELKETKINLERSM